VSDAALAFPAIVRDHQDRVFSLALRLCAGDRAAAEDLAHDVFVRAYHALCGYDAVRRRQLAVRPWLATIALNAARNRARDAARRRDRVSRDGTVPDRAGPALDGPAEAALGAATRTQLAVALDALPAAQREAVVLRHVAGLSYAEAGDVLGRPVGTVKSDVHRALATLRQLVTRDQDEEDDA
jgi:RNA polymerase sigma-70 factor (ECF subfamily)